MHCVCQVAARCWNEEHHVNVQAICEILRSCSHTIRFSTRVVLQVSGGAITSESGSNLASLITENSNVLIVDITEVSVGKKVPR